MSDRPSSAPDPRRDVLPAVSAPEPDELLPWDHPDADPLGDVRRAAAAARDRPRRQPDPVKFEAWARAEWDRLNEAQRRRRAPDWDWRWWLLAGAAAATWALYFVRHVL